MLNNNSLLGLDDRIVPPGEPGEPLSPARTASPGDGLRLGSHYRPRPYLAGILPRPHFLKMLRRERLLADRTKVPLSIAIMRFDNGDYDDPASTRTQQFLEYLEGAVRETDILGYLGDGRVALLLVDTDEEGRNAYLEKLINGYRDLPASVSAATYPEQIFQSLMAENRDALETCPFYLDLATRYTCPGYALKRTVDVIGAAVGIALLSPVMILTALAIKATSPGPAIYKQIRLGENGQPFVFYKFRSMASNADDSIHREYIASLISGNTHAINQGSSDAPLYKLRGDPRVTRVGRFIRRMSIDEIPQFFNVLEGNMSLVGPRPPLPYEAEKYQSWHFRRIFEMKPGITGLWQVEGRSRTSFDGMVRLDLEYIRRCSLALDLKILLKTIKVVLRGVGAA